MKIVFLCSCLEPGRDGVGDYTRRLASELIRQGHFSTVLSLNDKYISDKYCNIQHSEGIDLPVLRLPAIWAMKIRLNHAKKYIDDFDPDWLSLQFVIFGFHPKGLPIGLGSQLAFLGTGRRWHIMFHELWVQVRVKFTLKFYLWGKFQYLLIKSLISDLKPKIIHTQTHLYQHQLAKLGFDNKYLPLFSNIPKIYKEHEELNPNQPLKLRKAITFVLFGSIHPNAPVEDFIEDVSAYATKNGVKMTLIIVGRCGVRQEYWSKLWESAGMYVNILGEQSVDIISKILRTASIGISTTPVLQIEKSGAVAAMRENGLPVICVAYPWQPKEFKEIPAPSGVITYKKGNLDELFEITLDIPVANGVNDICDQFITALLASV
jgi:glycosyltransferase involved in cell wall biosynthesis